MQDPYFYKGTECLKNKLDIRNAEEINRFESDFATLRLKYLKDNSLSGDYDFKHLCAFHQFLFQDVYEWAGKPRVIDIVKAEPSLGGLSLEYCKWSEIEDRGNEALAKMCSVPWKELPQEERAAAFANRMAEVWHVHPFREGNTRTTVNFCVQYIKDQGIAIDETLFSRNSAYMRDALVAASAVFHDLGDLSKPEYLNKIVADAMQRGGREQQQVRPSIKERIAKANERLAHEKGQPKTAVKKIDKEPSL